MLRYGKGITVNLISEKERETVQKSCLTHKFVFRCVRWKITFLCPVKVNTMFNSKNNYTLEYVRGVNIIIKK